MTLSELSQLFFLKREIESDQRRLARLMEERTAEEERLTEMRLCLDGLASPKLDGMPHGTTVGNKVESDVIRLDELEARVTAKRAAILNLETMISQRQTLCLMERARLEEYINTIADSLTRQIISARFVDGMTWDAVADVTGAHSVDAVKKTCYRYIRTH